MLDVSVFTNMRFTAGSLSVTFAFFALFGFIFMVTQYFQFVRGYDTLEAGVRTVPFALFTGIAAPLSAKLAHRFGTKAVVAAGLASMAIGFAWTTVDQVDTSYWLIVGQMLFMGGGLGLVNAPATEAIMGSLPPEKAGVGSAVNDTTRELGGTLGVAIVGSLFASIYASKLGEVLAGSPVPAEALATAKESVGRGAAVAKAAGEQIGPEAGRLRAERGEHGVHRRLPRRVRGCRPWWCSPARCSPGASCPAAPHTCVHLADADRSVGEVAPVA